LFWPSFLLPIISLRSNIEVEFFSAVSHCIIGSVCVVCSHCKNVYVSMCLQLGKENT
jgi:hypothetical protein